jgi:hypothetical protein
MRTLILVFVLMVVLAEQVGDKNGVHHWFVGKTLQELSGCSGHPISAIRSIMIVSPPPVIHAYSPTARTQIWLDGMSTESNLAQGQGSFQSNNTIHFRNRINSGTIFMFR